MKRTKYGLPHREPWEIKQDERNAAISKARAKVEVKNNE